MDMTRTAAAVETIRRDLLDAIPTDIKLVNMSDPSKEIYGAALQYINELQADKKRFLAEINESRAQNRAILGKACKETAEEQNDTLEDECDDLMVQLARAKTYLERAELLAARGQCGTKAGKAIVQR
jgi:hypothetical protein